MAHKTTLALLSLAIATTTAAAQSNRKPTWDDLLKPYEAKTSPAIPIAPPTPPAAAPQLGPTRSATSDCTLMAAAQLLTAIQFSRPLYPSEVRQITNTCANETWAKKQSARD